MVAVSKIEIGERRRKKLGPLASLAKSIEARGLLHPIVVDGDGVLVAGQRRLEACKKLGWAKVPVRRFEKLTEDELRALELDENVERLDLSSYDESKLRLREIEAATAEANEVSSQLATKRTGRPKGGDREASRRTGISPDEIRRARQHVDTADEFPVFQGKQWKRSQVLAAREVLEQLPKRDSPVAVEMISEPGVDPKSAITMLETLADKPADERREIIDLYKSGEPEKQSLAKTRAAKLPPMPDPRKTMTHELLRLAERCVKAKHDDLSGAYENLVDEIGKIIGELDEAYEELRRSA